MRILVVEDTTELREALVELLEGESYAVDVAATGSEADELFSLYSYDLVLLDWSIPPPSGIELLRQWRAEGVETPVLMLTGRDGVDARVDGLDTGADDYLVKPFSFVELLARTRSLLRRSPRPLTGELVVNGIHMDRPRHQVLVEGKEVELSPKEFALLEYFLRRPGEVLTRTELAEHVWDANFDPMSNAIDVAVFRLRRRLEEAGGAEVLTTVKGIGYKLEGAPESKMDKQ